MQGKVIKIVVAIIVGLLSISTTAFASYKMLDTKQEPTATPEVIEKVEVTEEVEIVKPNVTPQPTTQSKNVISVKTSAQVNSTLSLEKFDDDDEDEVEFEDHVEDEKEDKKDDEVKDTNEKEDN